MNTQKDSWYWNWETEKAFYEENLLPIKTSFKEAINNIPVDKRFKVSSLLLEDLWNTVYIDNLPACQAIMPRNTAPDISTGLIRSKRFRSCSQSDGVPKQSKITNPGMVGLAKLAHYDCVLKRRVGERPFYQALRTVLMESTARSICGDQDKWLHLSDEKFEPVVLPPSKTKVRWALFVCDFKDKLATFKWLRKTKVFQLWAVKVTKKWGEVTKDDWVLSPEFPARESYALNFLKGARGQV